MTLTDDEIRIKVAEACGWESIEHAPYDMRHVDRGDLHGKRNGVYDSLPDYPESLDACAEFEKTLTDAEQASYVLFLNTQHPVSDILYPDQTERGFPKKLAGEVFGLVSATARQRCIAFLKTKEVQPQPTNQNERTY